jgi:UDP-glucose 4-epimerase
MTKSLNMSQNVALVTGCAGYIGRFLLLELVNQGNYEVIGVDKPDAIKSLEESLSPKELSRFSRIAVDLSDARQVQQLPDCQFIFHLAAMNGTQLFYEIPWTVFFNSLVPTINLISRYGRSKSLKNFVYTSSSEVYADLTEYNVNNEYTNESSYVGFKDVANPRWSYGGAKLAGEIAVFSANKEFGMPMSVLRYHNVYGPGMGPNHVIPDFVERGKRGIYYLSGAENIRSFIFIEDAVKATCLLAQHPSAKNRITHIGNSEPISMIELGRKIMKLMEWEGTITVDSAPIGSVLRRAPDVTFLRDTLKFQSSVNLEEGLIRTLFPDDSKGIT